MEKTVKRFLDVILDQATPLIATLNKGVTDSQIAEFEAEMGITLPTEVKQLYQKRVSFSTNSFLFTKNLYYNGVFQN